MNKKVGKRFIYTYTFVSLFGSVSLFLINYKFIGLILFIQYFMVLLFIDFIKNKKIIQLLLSLFLIGIIIIILNVYYSPLNIYNLITNHGSYSINSIIVGIYMITTILICLISFPIVLIKLTYFILAMTNFNNKVYLDKLYNNRVGIFISKMDPFFKNAYIKYKRLIINTFVELVFLIVIVYLLKISFTYFKTL